MRKNILLTCLFFVLVAGVVIVSISCDGTSTPPPCPTGCVCNTNKTAGNDEFKKWYDIVYKAHSGSSLTQVTCWGWNPFVTGDELSTDSNGEAELNFSSCGGSLFLFRDSSSVLRVASCDKASYPDLADICVNNGTIYTNGCTGEYTLDSGSARIRKMSSAFSMTYIPGNSNITVVIVLEGEVMVEPVLKFGEVAELGEPVPVVGGEFYFTMPDEFIHPIGGLDPRAKYPLDRLPLPISELNIRTWMIDIYNTAIEQKVVPQNWPIEFTPGGEVIPTTPGFTVALDGGLLADPSLQDAVLQSVDWSSDFKGQNVYTRGALISSQPELSYNPLAAMDFFKSKAPDGLFITILYPMEETGFAAISEIIIQELAKVGIKAASSPVAPGDLITRQSTYIQSGEPFIVLQR